MAQSNSATSKTTTSGDHQLSDKVIDSLHESVDKLGAKAAATEAQVRSSAKAGTETLTAKQKELEAKWEQSSVKRYASENPIATAGIAFAAGMLLSSLLKRR